jgi:hypothetical protein
MGMEDYDNEMGGQDFIDEENECYYGCEFCLDPFLRDNCGCVGCEVQSIPEEPPVPTCPHCDVPMEREEEELNGEPTFTCKKCQKIVKCTRTHIEKLWEDLCGPKPLGLIDHVNRSNIAEQSLVESKEVEQK